MGGPCEHQQPQVVGMFLISKLSHVSFMFRLLMMKIGSSSGAIPWPGTCTSGLTGYPFISELFLNDIFPGLQLELPLSARSTESVRITGPPPPTGLVVTVVLPGRLCKPLRV